MKRRAFNLLTAMSLLLCAAEIALWARSHWRMDEVRFASAGGQFGRVCSGRGHVEWLTWDNWPCDEPVRWRSAAAGRFPDWPPLTGLPRDGPIRQSGRGGTARTFYRPDGVPPPAGNWQSVVNQPQFAVTNFARFRTRTFRHKDLLPPLTILPAVWLADTLFRWVVGRRRRGAGHCPACGYDLRATPDRCPECGAAAAATTPPG